ncbi:VOC family protein [Ruicaihuangia caeni]|uniref:VOC family protein n=1 Tax=Ruicaihuangia caeni TaxID=3042517 RepID=A0AAW6T870_9MICO|nr:VOC family protein [Klugiella sp. YN-L-19]MDI2098273.1 VOC family protein [Klugiella sp. YN-L-19]
MAQLNAYLQFRDNAREAITFYQSVFGGDLTLSTFGEFGITDDPAHSNMVMHAQLMAPGGLALMAADTPPGMDYNGGSSISLSLSGPAGDDALLRGYWEKLLEGGEVREPLAQAPWGDSFGMLRDRFGINWMVNIAGAGEGAAGSGMGESVAEPGGEASGAAD